MKLKKCPVCKTYTLLDNCKCKEKTISAHYKFLHLRDEPNRFRRK